MVTKLYLPMTTNMNSRFIVKNKKPLFLGSFQVRRSFTMEGEKEVKVHVFSEDGIFFFDLIIQ